MSDCFDHELDAWESYEQEALWGEGRGPNFYSSKKKDPLYYHDIYYFSEILAESEKAYLFKFNYMSIWVPRKICRNLDVEEKNAYIHKKTLNELIDQSLNYVP